MLPPPYTQSTATPRGQAKASTPLASRDATEHSCPPPSPVPLQRSLGKGKQPPGGSSKQQPAKGGGFPGSSKPSGSSGGGLPGSSGSSGGFGGLGDLFKKGGAEKAAGGFGGFGGAGAGGSGGGGGGGWNWGDKGEWDVWFGGGGGGGGGGCEWQQW